MSIKVLCRIKLPFIVRLQDSRLFTVTLSESREFKEFNITFYPNADTIHNDLFNPEFKENLCLYLEIEAVINGFESDIYSVESTAMYRVLKVPHSDRIIIFNKIKERLNDYLKYLRYATKMFWIEELAINPLSGVIGTRTDFAFMPSDELINTSGRVWSTIHDNYMVDIQHQTIKRIDEALLNTYNHQYISTHVWFDYLQKASKALYQSEYENLIIYAAIAGESFIKQLISTFATSDIVLNKLMEAGKNQMVECYYKVISKYVFGKNLLDIDEALYHNLRNIFKLRNEIMHKGFLDEESFSKAGIVKLDYETCKIMLERLEKGINEMLKLSAHSTSV